MSKTQLLKVFVNERLEAAAVEIFGVFEKIISEYENEIDHQRKLLDQLVLKPQADPSSLPLSVVPVCEEDASPEQEWGPSLDQRDSGQPQFKEEEQQIWTSQGEEEHFKKPYEEADIIQFVLPCTTPAAKSDCDHQDTISSSPPQIQNSDHMNEMPQLIPRNHKQPKDSSGVSNKSRKSTDSSHGKPASFCCKVCGKSFQYKGFLIKHLRQTHTDEKEMVCGVCGERFESLESFTDHLKSHDEKHVCHVCGACFTKSNVLAAHMTCHREVKRHRCHVCGRECGRKGDLKIHMRIHTGEKPYSCSFCGKGFTHSGHLKKHMRTHTGERLYHCQVCDKGFTQTSRLMRHISCNSECRSQQLNLSPVN